VRLSFNNGFRSLVVIRDLGFLVFDPLTQAQARRHSLWDGDPVGVIQAHEAINSRSRIPRDDPQRKRGSQIVADWLKHNK
jgi:hypothetical protein